MFIWAGLEMWTWCESSQLSFPEVCLFSFLGGCFKKNSKYRDNKSLDDHSSSTPFNSIKGWGFKAFCQRLDLKKAFYEGDTCDSATQARTVLTCRERRTESLFGGRGTPTLIPSAVDGSHPAHPCSSLLTWRLGPWAYIRELNIFAPAVWEMHSDLASDSGL